MITSLLNPQITITSLSFMPKIDENHYQSQKITLVVNSNL